MRPSRLPRWLRAAMVVAALIIGVPALWLLYAANSHVSLEPYRDLFAQPIAGDPGGRAITVQFLGNTNLLLSDGATSILTDGFFSNPGMGSLLFGRIAPRPEVVAQALLRARVSELAAVLVTHSHYDHAMDAPEVARLTGALFVGSESSANVARGWGLPERQIHVVRPSEPLRFGDFTIRMIPSRHFEFPQGWFSGPADSRAEITTPLQPPVPVSAYREGGTYSVLIGHPLGNVLIQGSAGFSPGALAGVRAQVAFLGIGGLGLQTHRYREDYFRETVEAVGARRIFPIHWDDMSRPLSAPLRPPNRFMDLFSRFRTSLEFTRHRIGRDPDRELALLPLWEEIELFRAETALHGTDRVQQ